MAYKKGENGSKGTIKRKPLSDALHAVLSRDPKDNLSDKPKTIAQELVLKLVRTARLAEEDNEYIPMMKELWDRAEGKAPISVEQTVRDERSESHYTDEDYAAFKRYYETTPRAPKA